MLVLLLLCASVSAEGLRHGGAFDLRIPGGSLVNAVQQLARQTGFELLFPSELEHAGDVEPLVGRLTVRQALRALLADSEFEGRITDEGVMTIFRRGENPRRQGGEMTTADSQSGALLSRWLAAALAIFAASSAVTLSVAHAQETAIEEVVVTARKREESILEIPVSVSAVSSATLDRAGIYRAQDLSALVPGLSFQQVSSTGRSNPDIRIRGMNQQVITPATQIGALFWDGSYIGGGGGLVPLGDMERVEVIRGPQTAYFGRNTFAGAINYIPREPGDTLAGNVAVSWSPTDGDEYNFSAGVGGPIGERLGLRVWAGYDRDGGDFEYGDGEPLGQTTDRSFQFTGTFQATESLRLKLTGYYTDAEGTLGSVGVLARVPPGACDLIYRGNTVNVLTGQLTPYQADLRQSTQALFCGRLPGDPILTVPLTRFPNAAQVVGGAAAVNVLNTLSPLGSRFSILKNPEGGLGEYNRTYRLQFSGDYEVAGHAFAFIASHANTGTVVRLDGNYGAPVNGTRQILPIGFDIATRENYAEARVTSPQGRRIRYLLGASLYKQDYDAQTYTSAGGPVDRQENETTGIFASVDFDLLDRLTLSAEMRYQDESSLIVQSGQQQVACGLVTICGLEDSVSTFLPRLIASYRPFERATAYVSWSSSKLLGVTTNARLINSIAPQVVPAEAVERYGDFTPAQRNTQVEVGWKQQWDRWSMALAIYRMDWENQPVPAVVFLPSGATSSFRAPGDSEYSGFELEVNGNVASWLALSAQVGYSDAEMTNFSNYGTNETAALRAPAPLSANGNPPRWNSEWTGSLSPTVFGEALGKQWFIRTDFVYTGAFYIDYAAYNRNPSKQVLNVRAGVEVRDGVRVELYGNNVFDDLTLPPAIATTAGPAARKIFGPVPQAREFGLRISAGF